MAESLKHRLIRALGQQDVDLSSIPENQRHGGSFATGAIDSMISGLTLPGDVYQGEVDLNSDEGFARVMDLAGTMQMGGIAGAPSGAVLGSGAARRSKQHAAPPPVGKWSRYAEEYLPPPPPADKIDMNKLNPATGLPGRPFVGKGQDALNTEFMADRLAHQRDMDANGFEPMFDPAQRYNVDPSFYPDNGQDVVSQLRGAGTTKASQAAQAKHLDLAQNDGALQRLEQAYLRGQQVPDADRWYWMGQLEKAFIDELGPEEGRQAFKERFAGAMAATTGGMSPEANLVAGAYGNFARNQGMRAAEQPFDVPSPLSGPYVGSNMRMFNNYAAGPDGLDMRALENPKRHNFQYNFLGHADKATIDDQMYQIMTGKSGAPDKPFYGLYEEAVHKLAEKYGIDPREFQEVAWAGGKAIKNEAKNNTLSSHQAGKPMIQTVNEAIERTHRLTGMDRKEILRRALIRGEIPLYSNGNPAAAGLMLGSDEE